MGGNNNVFPVAHFLFVGHCEFFRELAVSTRRLKKFPFKDAFFRHIGYRDTPGSWRPEFDSRRLMREKNVKVKMDAVHKTSKVQLELPYKKV